MEEFFQDRRSKARGGEKGDASLSTLISIYLLILSFLVTMHSVSSIELSKVSATVTAVQKAFHGYDKNATSSFVEYEIDAEDIGGDFTVRGGVQPFYEEGARLIQRSLSLDGDIKIREGQGLFVDVPANRIFIGVSHLVRPEFELFADEIATLIAASGSREKREIEVVFGIKPGEDRAAAYVLAQKRIESLARNLIDQGVKPENIIIGLRENGNNAVTIGFYSRLKNGAELDFANLKGAEG